MESRGRVLPSKPVASKSAYRDSEPGAEIEEMLDTVETALDRLKVMFEQYFLGILKAAPSHLHTDVERRLRDLAQFQIRNTALRYRLATVQQKYGAYNTYWRRTLRQIEQGTYVRSLSKVSRKAAASGGEIPEEILAAMPKRMRDQVARDRHLATAKAKRAGAIDTGLGPDDYNVELDDDVAHIVSAPPRDPGGIVHRVDTAEMDQDDLEQMLAELAAVDVIRPEPAPPPARTPKPSRPLPTIAHEPPPPRNPA